MYTVIKTHSSFQEAWFCHGTIHPVYDFPFKQLFLLCLAPAFVFVQAIFCCIQPCSAYNIHIHTISQFNNLLCSSHPCRRTIHNSIAAGFFEIADFFYIKIHGAKSFMFAQHGTSVIKKCKIFRSISAFLCRYMCHTRLRFGMHFRKIGNGMIMHGGNTHLFRCNIASDCSDFFHSKPSIIVTLNKHIIADYIPYFQQINL